MLSAEGHGHSIGVVVVDAHVRRAGSSHAARALCLLTPLPSGRAHTCIPDLARYDYICYYANLGVMCVGSVKSFNRDVNTMVKCTLTCRSDHSRDLLTINPITNTTNENNNPRPWRGGGVQPPPLSFFSR